MRLRHLARMILGLGALAAAPQLAGTELPGRPVAPLTPIISELFAEPAKFVGQPITVYGLTIEGRDDGRRFLLQDVSQMPLVVVAPAGERVGAGRQLMVRGVLRWSNGQLELAGKWIQDVKVLAGGGCC